MAAPRGILYRIEIIEEVRRQLRCLPEPKIAAVSKLEVVRALAPDIEQLQKAGHTIETIASTLSGLGVQLTKATLKTYLGKLRPAGHRGRGRRRQGAGGRPATGPESIEGMAAGTSTPAGASECDAPPLDNDGIRATGMNAHSLSADHRKVKRSLTTQDTPKKRSASASALGGRKAMPAAGIAATLDASPHPEGFEPQHGTNVGSNGGETRSELSLVKSEKAAVRGAGPSAPIERPAWTFVPRQDSNDI